MRQIILIYYKLYVCSNKYNYIKVLKSYMITTIKIIKIYLKSKVIAKFVVEGEKVYI